MSKIVYELTRYHRCRCYRKGDLEDEQVQDFSETFSTRTAANSFLERKKLEADRVHYKTEINLVKRGNGDSSLFVETGDEWINENTGEECYEYYWYTVKKKQL